jgi:hypothetical protein
MTIETEVSEHALRQSSQSQCVPKDAPAFLDKKLAGVLEPADGQKRLT